MEYYFSKILQTNFKDAVEKTKQELSNQGFGILTEIDVQATLQKKIGENFRPYKILGACSPPHAYDALKVESKIGTMLPCNVIVQEDKNGDIEVAAVNPVASMESVENAELKKVADKIRLKLNQAIENL